jgi:ACS family hexuronate transporter-like MFS transporter
MMLGTLLSYVDRGSLALLSPMFLSATKMKRAAVQLVYQRIQLCLHVCGAWLGIGARSDWPRLGMTISLFIWMVSSASHAWSDRFSALRWPAPRSASARGSIFPGGFRTALDSLPVDKQARGIALAYSGSSLGSIVAPILLTPIAIAYGWRIAFLVTPALALVWLFLWRGTVDPGKVPEQDPSAAAARPAQHA